MRILITTALGLLAGVTAQNKCTHDDVVYEFSECESIVEKTNVFFYYPKKKHCNLAISDKLPSMLEGVSCANICPKSGEYTGIIFGDHPSDVKFECT